MLPPNQSIPADSELKDLYSRRVSAISSDCKRRRDSVGGPGAPNLEHDQDGERPPIKQRRVDMTGKEHIQSLVLASCKYTLR